jgi:hypothetical protein
MLKRHTKFSKLPFIRHFLCSESQILLNLFAIYPFLPFIRLPFIRLAKVWLPYTQSMRLGNFCHLSVIAI